MRNRFQLWVSLRNCLIALVFGTVPALANPLDVPIGTSLPIGGYSNSHHQEMAMCAAGQAIVSIAVGQGDFVRALWFHCEDVFGGGYTGDTLFEHRVGTDSTVPAIVGTYYGSGTAGDDIHCGHGEFAVGVRGKVSSIGSQVAGFQLLCGNGRDQATASDFGGRSRKRDDELLTDTAFSCGPGKIAVGIVGYETHAYESITGFSFYCDSLKTTVTMGGGYGGGFVGNWTVTLSDGSNFPMTLYLSNGKIVGVYDQAARNGIVQNGTVMVGGNDLAFNWQTTGTVKGTGTATFHLDDTTHMSGGWTMGAFHGAWTATKGLGLGSP